MNDYYDGIPVSAHRMPYEHLLHCVDVLRNTVMCEADDQPLALTQVMFAENITASAPSPGQITMCRDWDAMSAWSRAHSACYRPGYRSQDGLDDIERFKNCPDGSQPWLDT